MLWRDSRIVKGTSIWSTMLSTLVGLVFVWGITLGLVQDPIWRWVAVGIVTIVFLALPGSLVCIHWLISPQYRKQYRLYRRGGPLPGYPSDRPWDSSSVGKSLEEYTDYYLDSNTKTILIMYSDDDRRKIKEEMYGSAAAIYGADDPFLKCREILAGYTVSFADWQVLCLKPEEKLQLEARDGRCSTYVSGELYRRIRDCARYNDELAAFISGGVTDDDLVRW